MPSNRRPAHEIVTGSDAGSGGEGCSQGFWRDKGPRACQGWKCASERDDNPQVTVVQEPGEKEKGKEEKDVAGHPAAE